ncbi:MAG: XisH family protein [Microscillaceae bacterium]|jgi:hypothetical protein|nr:XisH family protein [Microscillaceae bacterium]
MPAKDIYHELLKTALQTLGWEVTHDPLVIPAGIRKVYIDLGAELIAAEKEEQKIAIEIKSFSRLSELSEFHSALGQFNFYKVALEIKEPERELYLAVPSDIYDDLFTDTFIQQVIERYALKIIVFDTQKPEILKWIS